MAGSAPAMGRARGEAGSSFSGESGIRTHGGVTPTHAFQACSLNHSDISPGDLCVFELKLFDCITNLESRNTFVDPGSAASEVVVLTKGNKRVRTNSATIARA